MSRRNVKQAFRAMKTTLIELRRIFHRLEDRVRTHALLCMMPERPGPRQPLLLPRGR